MHNFCELVIREAEILPILQNGIVCKLGKNKIYSYVVKKRLSIYSNRTVTSCYPNRTFRDALDTLIEQSRHNFI